MKIMIKIIIVFFSLMISPSFAQYDASSREVREERDDTVGTVSYLNFIFKSFPSFSYTFMESRQESGDPYQPPYTALSEMTSKISHSLGGEIDFFYNNFFLRGLYQYCNYKFNNLGTSTNHYWGIDLSLFVEQYKSMYTVFALGYRYIHAKREYSETFQTFNSNLSYSEPIIVIILGSHLDQSGFVVNAETDLNILGIPNIFNAYGETKHLGFGFILDFGVRFSAIPLSLMIGGEIQAYQFKYTSTRRSTVPTFADIYKKAKIDATYGVTLKLTYNIKL